MHLGDELELLGAPRLSRNRGIILKSSREIEAMRQAGRVVFQTLERVRKAAVAGVTTAELNEIAEKYITECGAEPLFLGVTNRQASFPFPAVLCISVNEEVVHGIPGDRRLKEGDIVSIDCGVRLDGYCGDSATTIPIGRIDDQVCRLLEVTEGSLKVCIDSMRPEMRWSEIAAKMQQLVEQAGMSVVRDFVGHGIGREMHEEPKVPNYWETSQKSLDFTLSPGIVLAIEPMVNLGKPGVEYGDRHGWVVVTKDRKPSAHFEHTVAMTTSGPDVLTDGR